MNFTALVGLLKQTHELAQERAASAINQGLVIRNWLIGYYIVEFEQNGEDFAQYGERLLYRISEEMTGAGIKGMSYTNLTLYRKFYLVYPQMGVIAHKTLVFSGKPNLQPVAEDLDEWQLPGEKLLKKLSFTHFVELLKVEEREKRLFYELECIKGNWSRRQLQRQIGSLLYERTGLSWNKEALLGQIKGDKQPLNIADFIREPYVFEFLGLKMEDAYPENDLERALLDH
ncbi:MAG: DUF1016 N-terminal domain-containing protein [Saprospiraceae bacterium]